MDDTFVGYWRGSKRSPYRELVRASSWNRTWLALLHRARRRIGDFLVLDSADDPEKISHPHARYISRARELRSYVGENDLMEVVADTIQDDGGDLIYEVDHGD